MSLAERPSITDRGAPSIGDCDDIETSGSGTFDQLPGGVRAVASHQVGVQVYPRRLIVLCGPVDTASSLQGQLGRCQRNAARHAPTQSTAGVLSATRPTLRP